MNEPKFPEWVEIINQLQKTAELELEEEKKKILKEHYAKQAERSQ